MAIPNWVHWLFRSSGEQQTSSSAMSSIVLLSVVGSGTLIAGAYTLRENTFLCNLLGVMSVVPLGIACLAYVYFAIREPDRLHSEGYRQRDRVLGIIEEKGGTIEMDKFSLNEMTNPSPTPKKLPPRTVATEEGDSEAEESEGRR